jgi:hypothetical protein
MQSIKTNPGGIVAVSETIGRGEFCQACWRALDQQSIRITAERRAGKTTVIRMLRAAPPGDTRTTFRDVGGLARVAEFVEFCMRDLEEVMKDETSFATGLRKFFKALGGWEIGGVIKIPTAAAPEWKHILENCFREVSRVTNDRVVLFWDEMPWMLQKMKEREGEATVIDLLDTLRGIRQTYPHIRMVYTGSIGFHHVISKLESAGYVSAPNSDMRLINVPPLSEADSVELATGLFQGEGIAVQDIQATAKCIHELTGGVPFYVHHVIAELANVGHASPAEAVKVVMRALTDPNDPWELRHLASRLKSYYGSRVGEAIAVLNTLAEADQMLGFEELQLGLAIPVAKPELTEMLRGLQQDHYVLQEGDTEFRYGFASALSKRWWRLHRGAEA